MRTPFAAGDHRSVECIYFGMVPPGSGLGHGSPAQGRTHSSVPRDVEEAVGHKIDVTCRSSARVLALSSPGSELAWSY